MIEHIIAFVLGICVTIIILKIKKGKNAYFPVFCILRIRTVDKNVFCKSCTVKTCMHNHSK